MNKSVILDIFHGVRGNCNTIRMPEREFKHMAEVDDIFELLKEKLSPELLALHNKYIDEFTKQWVEEVGHYYTEGFKLGILIGIECKE